MPPAPPQLTDSQSRIEAIYRQYAAIARTVGLDPKSGLGGKLLYAGEIAFQDAALLYAANIAGAASLAASADPAIQRQAIRDASVDFLVTSLEEALRILKNEIRKRQTVSVAVTIEPKLLVERMLDRGVLPDLLPAANWSSLEHAEAFLTQGSLQIVEPVRSSFVHWRVDRDFARWLPRLDACVQDALPTEDERRRWIRLAPRYLGRITQRARGVPMEAAEEARFRSSVAELTGSENGSPSVEISVKP